MITNHSSKHRRRQQEEQQNISERSLTIPQCDFDSMLPDDIVVKIGKSVAKLCGLRDFVSLSRASKRLKRLLIDSEETVSDVIRIRIDCSYSSYFLSSPFAVRTLEQMGFYESCVAAGHHYLLEETNKFHNFEDTEIEFNSNGDSISVRRRRIRHGAADSYRESKSTPSGQGRGSSFFDFFKALRSRKGGTNDHDQTSFRGFFKLPSLNAKKRRKPRKRNGIYLPQNERNRNYHQHTIFAIMSDSQD